MDVLIVGAGAMGRWFAGIVDGPGTGVAFTDLDAERAERAAAERDARAVPTDTDERFEVVCLAVPIPAIEEAIAAYAPAAERAVVDFSGVMTGPVAAMAEHAPDRERVSLHALFAPDNAPGNVAVVENGSGPVAGTIRERLRADGNALIETTPEEHDRAMETIQAKVHAAILAFALAAEEVPEGFETPVSAGLCELVEAVTGGAPRVYADIQATFEGADAVAAAAARIADADHGDVEALYREAKR